MEKWNDTVTTILVNEDPFWPLRDILLQMKSEGISSDEAYAYFENLRQKASDEKAEDKIMDVMDIISGWCSPHLRVW